MKQNNLLKMLEWRMEIDQDWSVKTGVLGKGLKKSLPPKLWAELESTYVGPGEEQNWEAMFRTIELFRKVAVKVGESLGYSYPYELDQKAVAYLRKVKDLDRDAEVVEF
jgi:aminoglycoside 6-adenylyltransferase